MRQASIEGKRLSSDLDSKRMSADIESLEKRMSTDIESLEKRMSGNMEGSEPHLGKGYVKYYLLFNEEDDKAYIRLGIGRWELD